MRAALARHDETMVAAIRAYGGEVAKKRGDGYRAAFEVPQKAASACIDVQWDISSEEWGDLPAAILVRMLLYRAAAKEWEGDYYGRLLNRAARLQAAAYGGYGDDAVRPVGPERAAPERSF